MLETLLNLFKEKGWLTSRSRQRTDSTHVLAKVRAINRLMCVDEAMRFALNSLAVIDGDWLLEHSDAVWVERYGHRIARNVFSQRREGEARSRRNHWSRWFYPLNGCMGFCHSCLVA
ncbi:hypothetical protein KSC_108050 [Ktedonobacter sp. SOSP1-52]|nr:hypothetical protein KSC_108050 [Ktedonobacter sp. SOSP1-52]